MFRHLSLASVVCLLLVGSLSAEPLKQEPNTWVKRSPLKGGPVSPGMGYETTLGWDPVAKRVIRWGGHNQGGGGEQNAETWTYDPATAKWELKEPNTSPPGVCCGQQNVFDSVGNRFLRFPAFSGSHGWHWFRENYLSNSTLWNYDLSTNTWRDMRPLPAPRVAPLRCASWDTDHQVAVVFGGEGSEEGTLLYDPYTNTWTRMSPKTQPAFRSGGNMAYDSKNKLHILFGAQFLDDPHTWAYDLRTNTNWFDMKPPKQPPTDRNDAVLAYDSINHVIIAVVRVVDKSDGSDITAGHLETWAYDADKNKWTQMKPAREPDGWGNRRRVMTFIPEQNVMLLEVYANPSERIPGVDREQQIWTYRYAEARPVALQPPTDVRVTTAKDAATITWKPNPAAVGHQIICYVGPERWNWTSSRAIQVGGKGETTWQDKDVKPGMIYHYAVRSLGERDQDSAFSPQVRTQPRVVEDVVVSVVSEREVKLTWEPREGNPVGYHVERAVVEVLTEDQIKRLKTDTKPLDKPSVGAVQAIGKFERITKDPVKDATFTDKGIDLTKPKKVEGDLLFKSRFGKDQLDADGKPYRFGVYAYRVRAVNALGVESGPSPYFLTIPSSPRWLFSKEDGEQCHLKWTANPEIGIQGYRIYRMEGPKVNGPGQPVTRLTADPVAKTQFTDPKAGKETKRYWVVAVDAIGQEGIPSAPTWHQRQFRSYYEPFVGEWHQ